MSTFWSSAIQDWNRHAVTGDSTDKLLKEQEGSTVKLLRK